MDFSSTSGLEWVLLFAIIGSMISIRINVPPVAGLLIAGALIGPNVFNLVEIPTITLFAEIGATLLLFMIGVEFSISKLIKTGLRSIIGGFILIVIMFAFMHEVAVLLGFDAITSLYVGAIFSFSSTAIMMKIMEQKGLIERTEIPILVAILIIEDIIAVFLLTFFSELKSGDFTIELIFGAVLLSLGILGLFYVIILGVLKKFSEFFMRYQADDTLIMFSIGLGIGMSILATYLGLTPAIGAFLAGSIIAGLPNGRVFEEAIKPFSRLFSSFFFLSIGMLIDPVSLFSNIHYAIILVGTFLFAVFITVAFTFYLISSKGSSSLFAGIAMLPLGEFSLLLAKESIGITEINLVSIVSAGVLVSSIICSVLASRDKEVYLFVKRTLPLRFLKTLKDASEYFVHVISAFEPNGPFHTAIFSEIKKVSSHVIYLLSILLLYFFGRLYLPQNIAILEYTFNSDIFFIGILAIISIVPILRLSFSIKRIIDTLSVIFSMSTLHETKGAISRNVSVALIFFFLFANTGVIVDVVKLPSIFNWFAAGFGLLSLFFLWSALNSAASGFKISEKRIVEFLSVDIIHFKKDKE